MNNCMFYKLTIPKLSETIDSREKSINLLINQKSLDIFSINDFCDNQVMAKKLKKIGELSKTPNENINTNSKANHQRPIRLLKTNLMQTKISKGFIKFTSCTSRKNETLNEKQIAHFKSNMSPILTQFEKQNFLRNYENKTEIRKNDHSDKNSKLKTSSFKKVNHVKFEKIDFLSRENSTSLNNKIKSIRLPEEFSIPDKKEDKYEFKKNRQKFYLDLEKIKDLNYKKILHPDKNLFERKLSNIKTKTLESNRKKIEKYINLTERRGICEDQVKILAECDKNLSKSKSFRSREIRNKKKVDLVVQKTLKTIRKGIKYDIDKQINDEMIKEKGPRHFVYEGSKGFFLKNKKLYLNIHK